MNPVFLQKQLRDNTNDLQEFCNELKIWSDEMKRKDESLKKPTNESTPSSKVRKVSKGTSPTSQETRKKPASRIGSTDYAAWEKFDVEKECQKIDDNKDSSSDSELTDEHDESMRDEALFEKEKGNKFVKQQNWDEAIDCYTKAIGCYGYDPIFYANRALCFLKKERWKDAETDSTTALQLDNTYVKAYQRRALAREKLNQVGEAISDTKKVLEFEPHNKESKVVLERLEKLMETQPKPTAVKEDQCIRPKSAYSKAKNLKHTPKIAASQTLTTKSEKNTQNSTANCLKQSQSDNNIEIIFVIEKPPHSRSQVPLRRIPIKEVSQIENVPLEEQKPTPSVGKLDSMNVVERNFENLISKGGDGDKVTNPKETMEKASSFKQKKQVKVVEKNPSASSQTELFTTPINAIQFNNQWHQFTSSKLRYQYLMCIEPQRLPTIFKESLDTKLFSEIITALVEGYSNENEKIYKYLTELTNIRRFSAIVMFMSNSDKNSLRKLLKHAEQNENCNEEVINFLKAKYEL